MIERLNDVVGEYFLNTFDIDRAFAIVHKSMILFLHHIQICTTISECEDGVFLSELAETTKMSISDTSKIITKLQEEGFVHWNMTEERDRTYVKLTDTAIQYLEEGHDKLQRVYEKIEAEIPRGDLEKTILTIREINEIVERING